MTVLHWTLRIFAIAILAGFLWVASFCAKAQGSYVLQWRVGAEIQGKILHGPLPERTQFKDEAECEAFGKEMAPRVADWVRGMFRLDWHVPVAVGFECSMAGKPA